MANKEYSMSFKLGAQLSREFGTTFSSAQKQVSQIQREINALNQVQGNITAYHKQQTAVEKSRQKLADLEKQYDNIQREIQETEGFSSDLENKLIDKGRAVDKARAAVEKETSRLHEMEGALRDAGVETDDLAGESARLEGEMRDLAEEAKKAGDNEEDFGEKGADAFNSISSAAVAAGLAKIIKELSGLYIQAVKDAAAYADEIGTIAAQYGIAQEELEGYRYAAELVDVSVDTITSSMAKQVKSMKAAQDGTENTKEAYEKLGIEVLNEDGTLRNANDVYWEVIDALGAMTNETERDATAQVILGRSAMELNTLIKAGSGTMKGYVEEAKNANYVLSDEMLTTLQRMDDEFQRTKASQEAVSHSLGAVFAPEITEATKLWNSFLQDIAGFIQNSPKAAKAIIAITAEAAAFLVVYKGYQVAKGVMNTLHAASSVLLAKQAALSTADAAAKTAEAAAIGKAAAAQTALNATQAVSPFGWVMLGLGALTAVITALAIATDEEEDEVSKLTASSRAQYEEIQKVNSEYEKACEVYGETSYEAQSLSWELEDLNAEFENGKRFAEEYYEGIEKELEAIKKSRTEYDNAVKSLEYETQGTSALIEKLIELSSTSYDAAKNQALIIPIVDELNKRYSELGLSVDKVTGQLSMSPEELREFAKQQAIIARNAQEYERYQEILAGNGKTGDDAVAPLETRKEELKTLEKEEAAALKAYEEFQHQEALLQKQYEDGEISYEVFTDKYMALTGPYTAAQEEYERARDSAEKIRNKLSDDENFLIDYETRIGIRTDGTIATAEEQMEILSSVFSNSFDEIIVEYDKLYEAAKESFDKQFGLFDEAKANADSTVKAAQEALDSQLIYWQAYGSNIETIKTKSAEDLGVTQESYDKFMAYVQAGTEEAAGLAASMAKAIEKGDSEAVAKLAQTFEAVQKERENAAQSIAEWQLDFDAKMEEVVLKTEETIDAMELSDEAKEAAKSTIEAYADGLLEGGIKAVNAADKLARQIKLALLDAAIGGPNILQSKYNVSTYTGHAAGTDYAPPGWAWVGENGPELMRMAGGEQVLSAEESRAFVDAMSSANPAMALSAVNGNTVITVAPVFHVDGEASNGQLAEFRDELISEVVDALEERGIDARRMEYV